MNHMVYGKHKDDKRFGPVDLHGGKIGVGLVFATLIPDVKRAKAYVDTLMAECPDYTFQVRVAGKSTVVYAPQRAVE